MKEIARYRMLVAAGVLLLALVGGIAAWRFSPDSRSPIGKAAKSEASRASVVEGATESAATPRERRVDEITEARKEVWALAGTGKDFRGAVAALDRNWERLGKDDRTQLAAAVVSKISAAGKLGDAELFHATTQEVLRSKIGSHVARAISEKDLGGAIDFISSIPEANIRDRIASDGLQYWPKVVGTEEGTKLFSNWLREEKDATVRLTIWNAIYSNRPEHWTQADMDAWIKLGQSLEVVAE